MESTHQSSCFTCDFRPDRLFCDMPAESLAAFDEIKLLASYPRSALLFADLKKRQIVQAKGSTLLIRNKAALKAMAIVQ